MYDFLYVFDFACNDAVTIAPQPPLSLPITGRIHKTQPAGVLDWYSCLNVDLHVYRTLQPLNASTMYQRMPYVACYSLQLKRQCSICIRPPCSPACLIHTTKQQQPRKRRKECLACTPHATCQQHARWCQRMRRTTWHST